MFPLFVAYTFWGIAESLTPVVAAGIMEGKGDTGDDDASGSSDIVPCECHLEVIRRPD